MIEPKLAEVDTSVTPPLYTITSVTNREIAVREPEPTPDPIVVDSVPDPEPVVRRRLRVDGDMVAVALYVSIVLLVIGALAGLVYGVIVAVTALVAWVVAHAWAIIGVVVGVVILLALLGGSGKCPGLHCLGCPGSHR